MDFELRHAEGCSGFTLFEGELSVGGGASDDVQIAGLLPGVLQLSVDPAGACIVATVAVSVSGVVLHPSVRRRLLAAEEVQLPGGTALRIVSVDAPAQTETPASTFAVFQGLFGAEDEDGAGAPRVVCLTGLDLDRVFPLAPEPLDIGRAWEADIRIRDRAVSRLHARITPIEGRHWIRDAGGANGVAINGRTVPTQALLEDGDLISIGFSVLRYVRPRPPPPAEAPAPPASSAAVDAPDPPSDESPDKRRDWPWMAAGATLMALGTFLGVTLA